MDQSCTEKDTATTTEKGQQSELVENSNKAAPVQWPPHKQCRVCGDKALGNNFGAVTCESCKAFFRRNYCRLRDLRCPFRGKCPTNIRSRKHCQKCRLIKCYAVGMNIQTIQKRRRNEPRDLSDEGTDGEEDDVQTDIREEISVMPGDGKNQTDNEIVLTVRLPSSAYGSQNEARDLAGRLLAAIKRVSSANANGVVEMNENDKDKDRTDSSMPPPRNHSSLATTVSAPVCAKNNENSMVEMNPAKGSSVVRPSAGMKYSVQQELQAASEEWRMASNMTAPLKGFTVADFTPDDFYRVVHHILERTIKQHYRLRAFRKLPFECQLALMKARARDLAILRTSITFDSTSGLVPVCYPGCPRLPLDITKRVSSNDYYKQLLRLQASYPDKFRIDSMLMHILTAVALFNPDSLVSTMRAPVTAEREGYLRLLKEYLDSQYGIGESSWAYSYLTSWVDYSSLWAVVNNPGTVFEIDPKTFNVVELRTSYFH